MRADRSKPAWPALLATLLTTGCAGPGYYVQAVSGHFELLRDRQDISAILQDSHADPDLTEHLETARDILAFSEQRLGLPAAESYQSYVETGRSAVAWNVVATSEFSLQARRWCFPVAGCVPYRGYFDPADAERFARKLRDRGMDVAVTPVLAYSSLGWFRDPLLDTMLRGKDWQLAAALFHELAHQRIYVRGDTTFNESYASFIERAGVEAWLSARQQSTEINDWRRRQSALDAFHDLLATTRNRLSILYASGLDPDGMRQSKAGILVDLKRRHDVLRTREWDGRDLFGGWFSAPVNNARLALFASYRDGMCAFGRLFEQAGGDFNRFHEMALTRASMPRAERREWLSRACTVIASTDDL